MTIIKQLIIFCNKNKSNLFKGIYLLKALTCMIFFLYTQKMLNKVILLFAHGNNIHSAVKALT